MQLKKVNETLFNGFFVPLIEKMGLVCSSLKDSNLTAPNTLTVISTIVLIGVTNVSGFYNICKLLSEEVPLELYHSPLWWKLMWPSQSVLTEKGR